MNADVLKIDPGLVAGQIATVVQDQVFHQLRRRGVVVGLSGGVDSTVVAALCPCVGYRLRPGPAHART